MLGSGAWVDLKVHSLGLFLFFCLGYVPTQYGPPNFVEHLSKEAVLGLG